MSNINNDNNQGNYSPRTLPSFDQSSGTKEVDFLLNQSNPVSGFGKLKGKLQQPGSRSQRFVNIDPDGKQRTLQRSSSSRTMKKRNSGYCIVYQGSRYYSLRYILNLLQMLMLMLSCNQHLRTINTQQDYTLNLT
ncbi:MAG: hypothetical protein EZS28_012310 [Streblomastix strix]|uniref:Uncharacterized protein n=1 Tax=Streblomastix strix TaxID=222440 RepID=A0A5J4WBX8_9EUKA|nr:MAG: hypothetical protein EZS28_012310 [Streblomastix strix]